MEPLVPAKIVQDENNRQDFIDRFNSDPDFRSHLGNLTEAEYIQQLDEQLARQKKSQVWKNDVYQVIVCPMGENWVHLSIKRNDRQPIRNWRDLQKIKNQLVGENCEAIEIFPAEERLVDSANQYHLWACTDSSFRFPFGFQQRLVMDDPPGKAVNKKFEKQPKGFKKP